MTVPAAQYRPAEMEEDRQSSASWMDEINAAYNRPLEEPALPKDPAGSMERMSLTTFDQQMQRNPTVKTNLGKASVSFDLPALETNSQANRRSRNDFANHHGTEAAPSLPPHRQPLPQQPPHMRDPQVQPKKKKTHWIKKLFSSKPQYKERPMQQRPQHYAEPRRSSSHRRQQPSSHYEQSAELPPASYQEEHGRPMFETENTPKNETIVAPYPVRASLFRPESLSLIERQREEEGGSHLIVAPEEAQKEDTLEEDDVPASAADLHLQKMQQKRVEEPLPERSMTPQNNSTLPSTAQSSRPNSRGSVQDMHGIFEELKETAEGSGQQSPDVIGQDLALDRQSFLFVDDTLMKFIQRRSALLEPPQASSIQQWTEGSVRHTKLPKMVGPAVPPRKTDSVMDLAATPVDTPQKTASPAPPAKEKPVVTSLEVPATRASKPKNPLRISTLKDRAQQAPAKRDSQVSSTSTATLLKSALKKRNSVKAERRVTFKDNMVDTPPRRTAPRAKSTSSAVLTPQDVLPSPPPRASQAESVNEEYMMQLLAVQQQMENERKAKESLRQTLRASQVNFDDFAEKGTLVFSHLSIGL